MARNIAVGVIHGIGSAKKIDPQDSAALSFSKNLHKRLRKTMGEDQFDESIAWREIFFSDILQKNQNELMQNVRRKTRWNKMRSFVVSALGDAAAYRRPKHPDDPDDPASALYRGIHGRVDATIMALQADTAADAPLVLLAHSMGGFVLFNHIWDCQDKGIGAFGSPMRDMRTVACFWTFGCNLPIFNLVLPYGERTAIHAPWEDLPEPLRQKPWWRNSYDKDDILGFPLAGTGKEFDELAQKGELRDSPINAGSFLSAWNPASHLGYWKDADFYQPVARQLGELLKKTNR